jgi:hypothetical protein
LNPVNDRGPNEFSDSGSRLYCMWVSPPLNLYDYRLFRENEQEINTTISRATAVLHFTVEKIF